MKPTKNVPESNMHYGRYLLRTSQHLTQSLSWYTSQKNTITWHMNHHYNIVKSTQHGLGTMAEAQSKSSGVQRAGISFENAKCFSWIFSILLTAMAVWRFRRFNLFLLSDSSLFVSLEDFLRHVELKKQPMHKNLSWLNPYMLSSLSRVLNIHIKPH